MPIAFIRHGETEWNANRRLQGSTDIPLNDTGRAQARDAVAALEGHDWHAIVSSPMKRARETAAIMAEGLGLPLGPSYDLLVERDYGEAEGITFEGIRERWPAHRRGDPFPGEEPLDQVIARGTAALQQISDEYAGSNVVVVCHGTIIRYTLASLAGRELELITNGSISTVDLVKGAWQVLTVNGVTLDALV